MLARFNELSHDENSFSIKGTQKGFCSNESIFPIISEESSYE